jgi:hypothetical protein
MPETEPLAHRRFEPVWPLAGLAWGVLLGIGTAVVPIVLVMLLGGAASEWDSAWLVPLMWLALFAITGAIHGGMVGLVIGLVVCSSSAAIPRSGPPDGNRPAWYSFSHRLPHSPCGISD